MPRFAYTVTATLPDNAAADEFVAWLAGGHTQAVIAGGALSATIVRLDPDPPASGENATPPSTAAPRPRIEVRYLFETRSAFEHYLVTHAPALRAEGLEKFGPHRGVVFARTTGEIVEGRPVSAAAPSNKSP